MIPAMVLIDPLTIGSLMVLAAAQPTCEMPARTKINVAPRSLEVGYDYGKSLRELQDYKIDTISPHGYGDIGYTQGFMQGRLTVSPQVIIKHQTLPKEGLACAWYDSINVTIELNPRIVIAREVWLDPCMREAVKEHEMKHVRADREIMNKYARLIGDRLYAMMEERGAKTRPVSLWSVGSVVEAMQKAVAEQLDREYAKMNLERAEAQQTIDSRAEYERVTAMCPGFARQQQNVIHPRRSRGLNE